MMNLTKKVTTLAISTSLAFGVIAVAPINQQAVQAATITKQQAIQNYKDYQGSYTKHEVPIIKAFEAQYDGSLADQIVARAIWYMENGYMVYKTAKYAETGMIDCSNFTKLVYGDFGIDITSVSRQYNQVGTKVAGVSSTKVGTSSSGQALYGIKGIENLRPGDILTYWAGTASNKYISHVAIYMGVINGKPAVINTVGNRPTAIGIVNNFSYWYGEKFLEARRILPSDAWTPSAASKYKDSGPVIPTNYYLPPQKTILMPNNKITTDSGTGTSGQHMTVTGNVVNIRSGPGTNYSTLGSLKNGDTITATGKSGSWIAIKMSNGKTGYVADWLVSESSTNNSTTNTSNSISKVTGNIVNVRSAPSTSSSVLGSVRKGDEVVVKKQLNGWYEIDWSGKTAYISSNLLSTPTKITSQNYATVTGSIVNMRSGPGRQYSVTSVVRNGDKIEVLSNGSEWTKIKANNKTGYIATWLLSA